MSSGLPGRAAHEAAPGEAGASPRASLLARALLGLIRLYQRALSPLLGPTCRFHPSCSCYAATCVERFGAARGSFLAVLRVARCHPFHPGGFDPPPLSLAPESAEPATHS